MTQLATPPIGPEKPLTAEDLEGDLIQPGHPLFGIIWINPQRMSGTPCFTGTRVPIKNLFDYVAGGEPLSEFLDGFLGVTRDQATAVLHLASMNLLEKLPAVTPNRAVGT